MRAFVSISIILMGVIFVACESATHIDKEAVIEEKVQERLDNFKNILFERCRKKILEEAEAMADSIILERARLLRDSLPRPEKPNRPDRPDLLTLKDSLNLAPLFDDSLAKPASDTMQDLK